MRKTAYALSLLSLLACCLLAAGCQPLYGSGSSTAGTTVSSAAAPEVPTSTESPTTTVGLAVQFNASGEAIQTDPPESGGLIGSWSYHNAEEKGDEFTEFVYFDADGSVCVSVKPDDVQYEGDSVYGTYRVKGTTLWIYGLGDEQHSVKYYLQGGVLRMPSPCDPGGPVRTYR